jgi:hypothetical protein
METRRECDNTQNEGEGRLLIGRDPCRPPTPEYSDDPSALLYKTKKVVMVEVMRQSPTNSH